MSQLPKSAREAEAELMISAECLVAAILAKGPKLYGLALELNSFRELLWETRSERYLEDVRSSIKNLSSNMLDAMDSVLEKMEAHKAREKHAHLERKSLKRKSKMN